MPKLRRSQAYCGFYKLRYKFYRLLMVICYHRVPYQVTTNSKQLVIYQGIIENRRKMFEIAIYYSQIS